LHPVDDPACSPLSFPLALSPLRVTKITPHTASTLLSLPNNGTTCLRWEKHPRLSSRRQHVTLERNDGLAAQSSPLPSQSPNFQPPFGTPNPLMLLPLRLGTHTPCAPLTPNSSAQAWRRPHPVTLGLIAQNTPEVNGCHFRAATVLEPCGTPAESYFLLFWDRLQECRLLCPFFFSHQVLR
jgi:hypothetical protein